MITSGRQEECRKTLEIKRPCGSSSSEGAGRKPSNSKRKGYFSGSIVAYLGRKTRASWPKARRALGKECITSPSPPTLTKGATSGATKRSRSFGFRLKTLIDEMASAMNVTVVPIYPYGDRKSR